MLPVSGPIVKTVFSPAFIDGYGSNVATRLYTSSYRQKRPYTLALAYTRDWAQAISAYGTALHWNNSLDFAIPYSDSYVQKAREKFVGKIRQETSELGVLFIERKKTLEMVVTRVTQFRKFVVEMKRLQFGEALRTLGVYSPRNALKLKNRREAGQSIGSLILELFWGWKPLVQDIWNSINVLQAPVKGPWVTGRSFEIVKGTWVPALLTTVDQFGTARASVSGGVLIDNPNLLLANQLGLVNPAGILWEIVPWSFLVDYFVSVGDFLNSFTEFWGVSIQNPSMTIRTACMSDYRYYNPAIGHLITRRNYRKIKTRTIGLPPGPSIRLENWKLSPSRAATSIGLLLQQLKGVRA